MGTLAAESFPPAPAPPLEPEGRRGRWRLGAGPAPQHFRVPSSLSEFHSTVRAELLLTTSAGFG